MTSRVFLALAAAALALPLGAAEGLAGLEGAVHRAAEERARLVEERQSRSAAAGALAGEIARLKAHEATPRAGRELEERLRAFDRLAAALDDLEARIAAGTRALEKARAAFDVAAEAESARLASAPDPRDAAVRLRAIEEARRRVAEGTAPQAGFRRLLDVRLEPGDGAPEVASKLALLEAERRRAQDQSGRLDEQERLLSARIELKRQLAGQVEAARRDAGGDFDLLAREADDLRFALRDLARQRDDVVRQRAEIAGAIPGLEQRIHELRVRLAPPHPPEAP